jgi:oligopeptide/dipeptide ABC transporter ATP-binding protein
MYLGKIVEVGTSEHVLEDPQHPYTQILLDSVPVADPRQARLNSPTVLRGEVPSAAAPPSGCRFHTRCPIARAPGPCSEKEPLLDSHGHHSQRSACHFSGESVLDNARRDNSRSP